MLARAQFSQDILSLNKFKFEKSVKVIAIAHKFLNVITRGKFFQKTRHDVKFRAFPSLVPSDISVRNMPKLLSETLRSSDSFTGISFGCKDPYLKFVGKYHVQISDEEMSRSLHYLFAKASAELKHFHKKEFLEKIGFERDGIIYCKSRLLEGHRLVEAGGLEGMDIVQDLNLNFSTPLVDRYSPLAYSLGDYIHRVLSNHAGYETSYRHSLSHCFILQGLSLFREIGENCTRCICVS